MRASSVGSESLRNLLSGTTRAVIFVLVFCVSIGVVASVDVRMMVSIVRDAAQFRAAGASVQVLKAQESIDGRRCEALAHTDALLHAGAIRRGDSLQIASLPTSWITVIEVTPGVLGMLSTIAQPVKVSTNDVLGVWLSADLAEVLGAAPGRVIQTTSGPVMVSGVYTWPNDGRSRDLGYSVIASVPSSGLFEQCWTEIWPSDQTLNGLSYMALNGSVQHSQIETKQLNSSLGVSDDLEVLYGNRLTAYAPWVSTAIGFGLGYVSVRLRRLEIASALHARVGRVAIMWQYLIETLIWASGACLIIAAGLLWVSFVDNPYPDWMIWRAGLRILGAGLSACILGVVVVVSTTFEKHLFRFSKDR
jgi:hypothetical protein